MRERKEVDPELHILRTLARRLADARDRQAMESARYNLYEAFEGKDREGATRWARALRVAVLAIPELDLRRAGLEAMAVIEGALS
jgi:hypothetical protein